MIRKHSFRGVGTGFAASALALFVSAQALAGTVTTDGADIVVKTKGGLEVGTVDKQFSFKIGGCLQLDGGSFDGFYTQNGNRADETYLRRARLEQRRVIELENPELPAETPFHRQELWYRPEAPSTDKE